MQALYYISSGKMGIHSHRSGPQCFSLPTVAAPLDAKKQQIALTT